MVSKGQIVGHGFKSHLGLGFFLSLQCTFLLEFTNLYALLFLSFEMYRFTCTIIFI